MKRILFLVIVIFTFPSFFIYSIEVRAPRDAVNTQCFVSHEKISYDRCCSKDNNGNEDVISALEDVEQVLCSKIELIDACDCATISSIVDESTNTLTSALEDVEQVLCSKIELIDACDCATISSIVDESTNTLTSALEDVEQVLCSKIELIDACDCATISSIVDESTNVLISALEDVEENLCSKIELIDACDCATISSIIDETRGVLCSKIDGIDCTCNCECNGNGGDCCSIIDDLALKVCALTSALDCLCVDRSGFGYITISNILEEINSIDGEVHAITIRNRTMFDGNPNIIVLFRIAGYGGGSVDTANKAVFIRAYKNATVTGTTFVDYDTANSVMEFSTDGTYTDATGTLVLIRPAVNNSNGPGLEWIPVDVYNIILEPGESLTITVENDNGLAQNVFAGFFLEERF